VVLPYPFALAAIPVATGTTAYGSVFVTWPGSHPPELSDQERDHLTVACDRQRLAESGDEPLDTLADRLVRHTPTAQGRPDDVALLLLRARTEEWRTEE